MTFDPEGKNPRKIRDDIIQSLYKDKRWVYLICDLNKNTFKDVPEKYVVSDPLS